MSRGGRWKTVAAGSESAASQTLGKRQIPLPRDGPIKAILDYITEAEAKEEAPLEDFVDWARRHIAGEAGPKVAKKVTIDVSHMDADEAAGFVLLLKRLFIDSPHEEAEYLRDPDKGTLDDADMMWAAAEHRYSVTRCLHKLLDTMTNLVSVGAEANDERHQRGAEVFTNSLARWVHRIQKRLEKRPIEKGRDETEVQLWNAELFQRKLEALRSHIASTSPKRRFVEYVCDWGIGYDYANAKLNGRELVIDGITWRWPKTEADFKEMRPVLQSVTVDHMDRFAEILEEDGMAADASKVRALTKSREKHRYYHKAQFDESFRSHFGLSKPRKTKAKKAAKAPKKQARKRG